MSSEDNYIVVEQGIVEEEDRVFYSPVAYFPSMYDAEVFCLSITKNPGTVLYVCDILQITNLPDSSPFAIIFGRDGKPKKAKLTLLYAIERWFNPTSPASVLLLVAFKAEIPEHIRRGIACQCVRSMISYCEAEKHRQEISESLDFLENAKYEEMHSSRRNRVSDIIKKMNNIKSAGGMNSFKIAESVLEICDTSYATSVELLENMGVNTCHLPSIIRGISGTISYKMFISTMASGIR